jgi:hypothetical protein
MNRRHASWIIVVIACLFGGWPASGNAAPPHKDRPSHVPLPSNPGSPEISLEDLQKQLEEMSDDVRFEELLKKAAKNPKDFGLDPTDPDLKKKLAKLDLNDPKVKQLVEKLAKKYSENPKAGEWGNIDEKDAKKLKELAEKYKNQERPPVGLPPTRPPGGDQNPPNGEKPSDVKPPVLPGNIRPPPRPGEPPIGNFPPPPKPTAEEKEAKKWYEGTAEFLEKFKGSKSVEKAIDSLTSGENGPDWLKDKDEKEDEEFDWDQFGQRIGFDKLEGWLPKMDGDWMNPKMPSMPSPNLENKSAPTIPPIGISEGGGVAAGVVLGLILLTVLLFAAWKLRHWFTAGAGDALIGRWRLGPWPVQPALVRTREELIRAFEYLSLLRLGKAARTWNHRQIAASLGGKSATPTECGEAADRLAQAYEKARYAPAADELPDRQLDAARRDLCLLAGVAGA